jgi:hypothetical protein
MELVGPPVTWCFVSMRESLVSAQGPKGECDEEAIENERCIDVIRPDSNGRMLK